MKIQFQFPNAKRCNKFRRENTTTMTKKKKGNFENPKCLHMMAMGEEVGRRYKMSRRRWNGTLSLCVAKLPWQKEFQHFVPLSKQEKEAPHDRTPRCCFLTFFSFFFFPFLFLSSSEQFAYTFSWMCFCCKKKSVLQEKCFSYKIKRNKIESTRQILEYLCSAKWLSKESGRDDETLLWKKHGWAT